MNRFPLIDLAAGGSLGMGSVLFVVSLQRGAVWSAAFFGLGVSVLTLLLWLTR